MRQPTLDEIHTTLNRPRCPHNKILCAQCSLKRDAWILSIFNVTPLDKPVYLTFLDEDNILYMYGERVIVCEAHIDLPQEVSEFLFGGVGKELAPPVEMWRD